MAPASQWQGRVRHHILTPQVHLFRRSVLGFDVTAVLLLSERFNVVVDTLCSPADMLPVHMVAVQQGRSRPILVVNTHADWDHVWGNSTFVGQPILAHRLCLSRLRRDGEREIAQMQARYPDCPAIPLHLPDIAFDGTLTIAGGDLSFRLLSTPGHTDDSITVHVPELDLLVAGDTVEYPLPRLSQPGLTQAFIRELYRLIALKPKLVIPSHGEVSHGSELVQANITYLRKLLSRVRAAVARKVPLEQLQQQINPESLIPAGYDLNYDPSVRDAHRDNIAHIYRELEESV